MSWFGQCVTIAMSFFYLSRPWCNRWKALLHLTYSYLVMDSNFFPETCSRWIVAEKVSTTAKLHWGWRISEGEYKTPQPAHSLPTCPWLWSWLWVVGVVCVLSRNLRLFTHFKKWPARKVQVWWLPYLHSSTRSLFSVVGPTYYPVCYCYNRPFTL